MYEFPSAPVTKSRAGVLKNQEVFLTVTRSCRLLSKRGAHLAAMLRCPTYLRTGWASGYQVVFAVPDAACGFHDCEEESETRYTLARCRSVGAASSPLPQKQ